jgi:hypothetical protein
MQLPSFIFNPPYRPCIINCIPLAPPKTKKGNSGFALITLLCLSHARRKNKKGREKNRNALISKTADPIFERLRLLSFAMLSCADE